MSRIFSLLSVLLILSAFVVSCNNAFNGGDSEQEYEPQHLLAALSSGDASTVVSAHQTLAPRGYDGIERPQIVGGFVVSCEAPATSAKEEVLPAAVTYNKSFEIGFDTDWVGGETINTLIVGSQGDAGHLRVDLSGQQGPNYKIILKISGDDTLVDRTFVLWLALKAGADDLRVGSYQSLSIDLVPEFEG